MSSIEEGFLVTLVLIFGTLFMLLILCYSIAVFINFEPDIQLSDEGLHIQVFLFWWVFVPWEDIETIQPTFTSHFLRNSSHIVIVRKLTPIHRWFGWWYAFKLKPGFLINRRIEKFDELLAIIKDKVGT